MAKANKEKTEAETPAAEQQPPQGNATTGIRAQRAILLKQFVPNPDWINKNVVAHGKGHKVIVARVVGVVIGTRDKQGTLPDGTPSTSIVLEGQFESESYLDGEIAAASSIYLPESFSGAIKAMFASDDALKTVQIDLDIGLEATGKTIPYTWVIINHVEQPATNLLKQMRLGRPKPSGAVAMLAAPK